METLTAINKKHQPMVNKAIKALIKYDHHNDLRDKASDADEVRKHDKQDKLCERYFNKYLEISSELPQREVDNIEKSKFY